MPIFISYMNMLSTAPGDSGQGSGPGLASFGSAISRGFDRFATSMTGVGGTPLASTLDEPATTSGRKILEELVKKEASLKDTEMKTSPVLTRTPEVSTRGGLVSSLMAPADDDYFSGASNLGPRTGKDGLLLGGSTSLTSPVLEQMAGEAKPEKWGEMVNFVKLSGYDKTFCLGCIRQAKICLRMTGSCTVAAHLRRKV